jgi:hypothetical protein
MQQLPMVVARRWLAQAAAGRAIALDRQSWSGSAKRIVLLLLLTLSACAPPPPLTHEAYIWQRLWTPALASAVPGQASSFSAWRVLALEIHAEQRVLLSPDLPLLADSARPVRLVVRIDGTRLPLTALALSAQLLPQIERWRRAGIDLRGVEIDHDCASSALADYAVWLRQLRIQLPRVLELSITALPTWIGTDALPGLLAAVDHSVLQVHAVDRPDRGLFDADRALAWTDAYARLAPHPFAVALPAYGVRVSTNADGRVLAVDAEAAINTSGTSGRELRAEPQIVAGYLQALRRARPSGLRGIVWFRLPLVGDRRAWSATTLAAVIAGAPLRAEFRVVTQRTDTGAFDLSVANVGNLDAPAPTIDLPEHCRFGDGMGQYRLLATGHSLGLQPRPETWIMAGQNVRAGWARCTGSLDQEWLLR